MYHRTKGLSFEAALRDMSAASPRARVMAAETLGCAEGEDQRDRAFDALAAGVGDARPEVRTASCFSLAALEVPAAWELIALCLSDSVPEVRQSAAISLGTLGAPEAFDALAEALREGSADLRFQAATSLVEVDVGKSYPHLIAALDDDDAEVVGAVALALGAVGNPEAADTIAALLDNGAPQTRLDAAYALSQLGDPRASETLASFLASTDLGWDAVVALETLGPDSIDHFRDFLDTPAGTSKVRIRAAGALLGLDSESYPSAQACLISGLRSRKVELRGLALQELAKSAGEWARPALQALHKSFRGRRVRDDIDSIFATLDTNNKRQS